MKKTTILFAIAAMCASLIVSCKDKTNDQTKIALEKNLEKPQGHPPKRGDRKGPPRGSGPEQTKTLEEIGGYKIGEVATNFKLKNVDGTMFSLTNVENAKGYSIAFTCYECPFAKLYQDRLIKLHHKYASQSYSVVAINSNNPENEKENYEAMQKRAVEKEFPFVYFEDKDQEIYPNYGAVRTPHLFLLDAERKVQYVGAVDDNLRSPEDVKIKFIENATEALKKGQNENLI